MNSSRFIKLIRISVWIIICLNSVTVNSEIRRKEKLSAAINAYQPTLIPVISTDGNYLYLDRARHPDNTGGMSDIDEIWVARKIRKCDLTVNFPTQFSNDEKKAKDFAAGDERNIYFGEPFINPIENGGEMIENLYIDLTKNGEWFEPENIGIPLNTKFSDVLFSISPDGNKALVYGVYDENLREKKQGFSISTKIGGKWSYPKPLQIKNYYNNSNGQAKNYYGYLSADGRILMLALNRYDGFGGMDLYVSFREDTTDIWTEPKNLGAAINTASDEAGPFLAYDGKSLYYASAGKGGFGGLDLFVARRLDDSWENWSEPENLGKDINSKFDEQNICLSALGDTAYIVATDTLNKRQAVYRVCVPEALQPGPYAIIHGSVFLLNNNVPSYCYEQLSFTVNFDEDKLPETYYSNTETGEFYFIAPAGAVNSILIEKNRYNPNYANIDTRNLKRPEKIRRDIVLRPLQESDGILITKVNYAKDIDTLTSLSKQIISDFLAGIKHPNRRKYLIIGHADDSGSDLYNLKLSMRRANIASEFLESFGISKENIRIEWRGEIQPLSSDKNENRRVEIYVD